MRRPLFIFAITASVVALAILSLVLAPKKRLGPGPLPTATFAPGDTVALLQELTQSQVRLSNADSALATVRQEVVTAAKQPAEPLDPQVARRHDSLTNVLTDLQGLIGKVENAPLPTSYRALAASPALIANPRINSLIDSLQEVEHQREQLGTDGGGDPMFAALTVRAADIGHAIDAVAAERRDSLRSTITRMTSPTQAVAEDRAGIPDTLPWITERDSARAAVTNATADLSAARRQLRDDRAELARSQKISVISASPFAMVVAAAVFGIVFGFAGALQAEWRGPTVATGAEVERVSGARIMAVVTPIPRQPEQERRQANRVAPRYLDVNGDSYRLAYLHLEQSVASPDIVAIIGDDPDVCAIAAMNFAAIAVEDARSVLVIDAAGRSQAIRSLSPMSGSGDLGAVVSGRLSWIEAAAQISVGRDKTVDVVTSDRPADSEPLLKLLAEDKSQLGTRYDTVFLTGDFDLVSALASDQVVGGTVIAATVGRTPLKDVVGAIDALRENARPISGVVLWDGAPPRLAARPKRRGGGDRKRTTPAQSPVPQRA